MSNLSLHSAPRAIIIAVFSLLCHFQSFPMLREFDVPDVVVRLASPYFCPYFSSYFSLYFPSYFYSKFYSFFSSCSSSYLLIFFSYFTHIFKNMAHVWSFLYFVFVFVFFRKKLFWKDLLLHFNVAILKWFSISHIYGISCSRTIGAFL